MRGVGVVLFIAVVAAGCTRGAVGGLEVVSPPGAPVEATLSVPAASPSVASEPSPSPVPPLPNRPPSAPRFAPDLFGAHHVPLSYRLWWAAAVDPDGDPLRYEVATRVADGPERVFCREVKFPPCVVELAPGLTHDVIVTASDGRGQASASVNLTARPPLLLLPDLDGDIEAWNETAGRLQADGFPVLSFSLTTGAALFNLTPGPRQGVAGFAADTLAPAIAHALGSEGYPPGQQVDVIALGAGGLAARVLAELAGTVEDTRVPTEWNAQIGVLILVGTPNAGADIPCGTRACRDGVPGSALLELLARDDPPPDTLTVSFDADAEFPADAMRVRGVPDTFVEGAGRHDALAREETYGLFLHALRMRSG